MAGTSRKRRARRTSTTTEVELSSDLDVGDGETMMSDGTQLEDDPGGVQGSSSSASGNASVVTMSSADLVSLIENSHKHIGRMLLGEQNAALDRKFKKMEAVLRGGASLSGEESTIPARRTILWNQCGTVWGRQGADKTRVWVRQLDDLGLEHHRRRRRQKLPPPAEGAGGGPRRWQVATARRSQWNIFDADCASFGVCPTMLRERLADSS